VTRKALLAILLGLLTLAGCGKGRPKKMQFNNMMARQNKRMADTAKAFYKVIQPIGGSGATVDPSRARSALNDCATALKDAQNAFDGLGAPVNSPAGESLLSRYNAFLRAEQDILDTCLKPIVQIIEDNGNYPDPGTKWAAISKLLREIDAKEKNAWGDLNRAQQEYAKAHKYRPS
jgi:hypothetical protein